MPLIPQLHYEQDDESFPTRKLRSKHQKIDLLAKCVVSWMSFSPGGTQSRFRRLIDSIRANYRGSANKLLRELERTAATSSRSAPKLPPSPGDTSSVSVATKLSTFPWNFGRIAGPFSGKIWKGSPGQNFQHTDLPAQTPQPFSAAETESFG